MSAINVAAQVHSTAQVHKNAKLGNNVTVGPYAVIGENVVVGDGTKIHAHAVLRGSILIGKNNEIFEHAVLGNPPQDKHYKNEKSFIEIGDNNIFREAVTVNLATGEGEVTRIGNDCFFMANAHVAHNCKVGNGVTMVNNSGLGGHVEVEDKAFISANSIVHQFCKIGSLAMIGLISPIEKDVPPYILGAGNPFTVFGLNKVGLERNNVPEKSRAALKKMFKIFFKSGLNTTQALTEIKAENIKDPYVDHFTEFVAASKRGVYKC